MDAQLDTIRKDAGDDNGKRLPGINMHISSFFVTNTTFYHSIGKEMSFVDKDRAAYGTSQTFKIVEEKADSCLDEVDLAVQKGSK